MSLIDNSANTWSPKNLAQFDTGDRSATEVFTASAGQVTFILLTFAYTLNTQSLQVFKNGLLLQPDTDWVELTATSVALTTPATLNDIIVIVGQTSSPVIPTTVLPANTTWIEFTSSIGLSSYPGIVVGHNIKTNYFDASKTIASGAQFRYTGTVDLARAGTVPNSNGFFYDADGKQYAVQSPYNMEQWGVILDSITDNAVALTSAITYIGTALQGGQGAILNGSTGVCGLKSTVTLPNRVGIKGPNGRGLTFKGLATFIGTNMFHAVNGTGSMFGSWLEDCVIDCDNAVSVGVQADAWQETCGLKRVLILEPITYGLRVSNGFGGASYLFLQDIEIFCNNASAVAGIRVDQISLVGGFMLHVDNASITGSATNSLPVGIDMLQDSLLATTYHNEFVTSGINMKGVGGLSVDTMTGSGNAVVDMIVLASTFTGPVNLRNIIPNGATGNTLTDNVAGTGQTIAASEGILPQYLGRESSFSVNVGTQIANVTGNGTEYVIVFDTEIFDTRSEFNLTNGRFTALRTGKYVLSCNVKVAVAVAVTTYVVSIATSNRVYTIYRGDTDNIRDGSGTVTVGGSILADMDIGDTADVRIIATGLGADTVDVEITETNFQGHWIGR